MDRVSKVEDEARFVRMAKAKTAPPANTPKIGESLVQFYKTAVQRTRKFSGIGEVWETLIPPDLLEHTCLESFRLGTLTILVDSSPHLYRLKQLLLSGLEKKLLELCRKDGLKKILLRPGRWYEGTSEADGRITFG